MIKKEKKKIKIGLREQIEIVVDSMIPFVAILLAIIIIASIFTDIDKEFYPWITILDSMIIAFFIIDLVFKFLRVKNLIRFVKLYWLDIIAVFPFYLIFRIYLVATEFIKAGEEAQKILHEAIVFQEMKIVREARFIREASLSLREARPFARIFLFLQRTIRVLRLRWHTAHLGLLHTHKRHKTEKLLEI